MGAGVLVGRVNGPVLSIPACLTVAFGGMTLAGLPGSILPLEKIAILGLLGASTAYTGIVAVYLSEKDEIHETAELFLRAVRHILRNRRL